MKTRRILLLGLVLAAITTIAADSLLPTQLWNEARTDKTLVTIGQKRMTVRMVDGRKVAIEIPILVERTTQKP